MVIVAVDGGTSVAPIRGGRESQRVGVLIDREYGCGCIRAAVGEGTGEVVIRNHPLDLRGWWHQPHIPKRGEEACGGFSSWSSTAHDSHKAPKTLR